MSEQLAPRERVRVIQEEIESEGAGAARASAVGAAPGTITVSLGNSSGKIALSWDNRGVVGKYDYVALYDTEPTDPYGYLTNQWTYVTQSLGVYRTGTDAQGTSGPAYWIAYVSYDYGVGKYVIVQTAGPSQP